MRLITRNDAPLVVGLIAGTVVIFQRPLIARLRRKLGGSFIETVRGMGYRIEEQA